MFTVCRGITFRYVEVWKSRKVAEELKGARRDGDNLHELDLVRKLACSA